MMNKNYNLKAVCAITGLTDHVIRAWEKRYSAITPQRDNNNRRVFSEDDLQKLILLSKLVNQGHNIGSIANLSIKELESHLSNYDIIEKPDNSSISNSDVNEIFALCINCIKQFNKKEFIKILGDLLLDYPKPKLLKDFIIPLLLKIGELWETGELRVIHEHFASSIIRSFLGSLLDSVVADDRSPVIITTTPKGFYHELGALISAIYASEFGWRPIFLGPNLPAEEIAFATKNNLASVILLSLIYPTDDPNLVTEIKRLRKFIGNDTKIIITGRASKNYHKKLEGENIIRIDKLEELKDLLNKFREM